MSTSPIPPPSVPVADFEFTFDASSNLFPPQPPLPSSADLFSASETTDLLGFLDKFNWEFDIPDSHYVDQNQHQQQQHPQLPPQNGSKSYAPYPSPNLPDASSSGRRTRASRLDPSRGHTLTPVEEPSALFPDPRDDDNNNNRPRSSNTSNESSTPPARPSPSRNPSEKSTSTTDSPSTPNAPTRSKPLLSTPQKRLNHIMSEQKRRNAIRDGYAQLIGLLAPAGSAPGIGMPTRGRPKGSGSRGKGRSKGKSGVLFRAVEYSRWLEEGRDALKQEVLFVEQAAGIPHH